MRYSVKSIRWTLTIFTSWALVASGCGDKDDQDEPTQDVSSDIQIISDVPVPDVSADVADTAQDGKGDDPGTQPDLPPDTTPEDTSDAGTDTKPADTNKPDAGPKGFTAIPVTATATAEAVTAQATELPASTAASLGSKRVLMASGENLMEIQDWDTDPINYSNTAGPVAAFAVIEPDTALVFAQNGIYVAGFEELVTSPLTETIQDVNAAVIQTTGKESWRLWMSAGGSLHLWEDGTLYAADIKEMPPFEGDVHLATSHGDTPTLWVANGNTLWGVVTDGNDVTAAPVLDEVPVSAMAVNEDNTLWVVSDGDVYRRPEDGEWEWLVFPNKVSTLAANPKYPAVWIAGDSAFWYLNGDDVIKVSGITLDTVLVMEEDGTALIGGNNGIIRATAGEPEIPQITWSKDVEPIFQNNCTPCHAAGGSVAELHEPEFWYNVADAPERWDKILGYIKSGYMPFGDDKELSPEEVQTIVYWGLGGYEE